MNRRQFPVSYGEEVPPACIRLVDQDGNLLNDKVIVLTKSKNELDLRNSSRICRLVKIEFENKSWWLQEVVLIKGELQNKNGRVKLIDQKITTIGPLRRPIRLFFYANLVQSLLQPNVIISQDQVIRAIKEIEEELTCSICIDVFKEPVIVGCGHTFCKICWSQWKRIQHNVPCPLCQQVITVELPNRQLLNIYEATEKLKIAIKSAPAVSKRTPELIIIDDEETIPTATVSPIIPHCQPVRSQSVEIIEDEVILIE